VEFRQALIDHLKGRGILSVFHYVPLHLSLMGQRFGGKAGDCPVTERVSERLLRLPFYNGITSEEQESVIRAVLAFGGGAA
jgi:dTDP-4-amino-4,6-dideoxygalactose transaminase